MLRRDKEPGGPRRSLHLHILLRGTTGSKKVLQFKSSYFPYISAPKDHNSQPIHFDEEYNTSDTLWPKCTPKKRIALSKNHKVAGDTVKNILHRFGYVHNLTFLLPRPFMPSRAYPRNFSSEVFMPVPNTTPADMWVYHAVYDGDWLRARLPPDTVRLTIIREPLAHFKSVWNYYNIQRRFKIPGNGTDSIFAFLENPLKYDQRCGHGPHAPLCLTLNSMAVDLGFPIDSNKKVLPGGDHEEKERITKDFVEKISQEFPLVMLTEQFDLSLILLRRNMCWSLKDILYYKVNSRQYDYKEVDIIGSHKQAHREWSYVDYALYDFFNRTFWERVSKEGDSFWDEVKFFRYVNEKMREHCDDIVWGNACSRHGSSLVVSDTRWGPGFTIDREFCLLAKRGLVCHYSIQAERNGRMLSMAPHSGTDTLQAIRRDAVYREHCVYCRTQWCHPLDYLTHFYRDGYISRTEYMLARRKNFPRSLRKCRLPPKVLSPSDRYLHSV
ncbi:PREDICTED: galactose-3-O-sulfotransferase 3-like [Branchiostoma belcheri]|uniref:Galactose-3-O-sulfotransferase 3-like n=1 Tax=Branchiostoma belcheri TaxID=7741 RepID=A0A6P4ZHG3_BRABE|nr:PREDICTED: galactose-3-O-sulfotransferase 3-like [Branchiostoma belcheri]